MTYLSDRINVGDLERLASVAGGALLAIYGLKRSSLTGASLAAAGTVLLARGLSGYCPVNQAVGRNTATYRAPKGVDIETTLTINKPREEVYDFWRRLENLPSFMEHVSDVRQISARRSHWEAPIPKMDATIEWEAKIETDEENERITWRSVEDADIENSGDVRFADAPEGTEVHVHITYRPPAGQAGRAAASLVNSAFEQLVKEDLRRFKHVMEAGEVPTNEGQPKG